MRGSLGLLVITVITLTACDSPIAPPPPPPVTPAPQISCTPSLTVDGAVGLSQAVTYTAPTVTDGTMPVTVACNPPSGSAFPLGETPVTCIAVDAQARQAACTFNVTVHHRGLTISTVVAFGDSMTEGENGRPLDVLPFLDIPNAYPTILQQYFRERIPSQQITVVNAGKSGERVTDNDSRLKQVLATYQPQVLVFLQGANDMTNAVPASTIANAIRDSIRTARDRGAQYIFVSTLLPTATTNCLPQPALPRCRGADVPPGLPAATNQLIRPIVPAAGAYLVDPYEEFVANSSSYIDIDGLHVAPAGARALATHFWNRIAEIVPARQLRGLTFTRPD